MAALAECSESADLIAVHDGARPLVTVEIIDAAIEKSRHGLRRGPGGAGEGHGEGGLGRCGGSHRRTAPPSSPCRRPQVFDRDLLQAALQAARDSGAEITDDCSAVERLGKEVSLTEGSYENLKITTPVDLILAEAIWGNREAMG